MGTFAGRRFLFWGALASFVLYWAALPPLGLEFAIYVVPAIWAVLASSDALFERSPATPRPDGWTRRLLSRLGRPFLGGPYRQLWTASLLFWLVVVVWVSYPHPATILGWLALSCYLACYFPLFLATTRGTSQLLRAPIWATAPASWVAVEYVRNRALGGFSFAGLSHAIYNQPYLIQTAEPLGEYGVGATIVLVGSLLGAAYLRRRAAKAANERSTGAVRLVSFAALVLFATVLYGLSRIASYEELENAAKEDGRPPLRLALLQDGTSYRFPVPTELDRKIAESYMALAAEASRDERGYDAVVWPEGCYPDYFIDFDEDLSDLFEYFDAQSDGAEPSAELRERRADFFAAPEPFRAERRERFLAARASMISGRARLARMTERLDVAAILGTTGVAFDKTGNETIYNSLVFVPNFGAKPTPEQLAAAPTSTPMDSEPNFRRYDKIRLVLFGEYIPFVEYLPDSWGLAAVCADSALGFGRAPTSFELSPRGTSTRFVIAPSICFESAIPQFVKEQIRFLKARGADPDVLVNSSNDGWFRNGMQTDLHLATKVYRAIENRLPTVSATHGGFSAFVDALGRVQTKGARRGTEIVPAEIPNLRFKRIGLINIGNARDIDLAETLAAICCWASFALGFISLFVRRGTSRRDASADESSDRPDA